MVMPKTQYRERTGKQFKGLEPIATPTSRTEFKALSKVNQQRFKEKRTDAKSFPGLIKDSDSYINRTPGLFTKSIKGMEGKHYIEKALTATIAEYITEKKHD